MPQSGRGAGSGGSQELGGRHGYRKLWQQVTKVCAAGVCSCAAVLQHLSWSGLQVGRGQKLGDGPGSGDFGDMTVEGLLQVWPLPESCMHIAAGACTRPRAPSSMW